MPVPSRPVPQLAREITLNQVNQLFENAHFPADRKQLVEFARGHFATDDFLAVLDSIPDRYYGNPSEIMSAIQQIGTGQQRRA